MRRFIKRLLLLLATLGTAAVTYKLMRAEGERALLKSRRGSRPLPPLEPSRAARKPAPVPDHAPAEPARCAAIKKSGQRCTRETQSGSDYCWQHG